MAPTLSPQTHETGKVDWVILRPYMERSAKRRETIEANEDEDEGHVKRGDVVTFWKPHKPEEMGIKRVVAVEGDIVYPTRGYALDPASREGRMQGMPDGLPDKDDDAIQQRDEQLGKVVVPYGHVWVEGDNWRKSFDSNDFGPISKGLIEGKAVWVWRTWFELLKVGDERNKREKKMRSRVVEGTSEIPAIFLE
ncbi:Nn.00g028770.m01.CDS01 [Neocucurbitaria sp. VM-36]